jgi:hypothetical protein
MTQPTPPRRIRFRLVLAAMALSVIGGTAIHAAAAAPSITCLGNSDSRSGGDKGICLIVPLPDLPR